MGVTGFLGGGRAKRYRRLRRVTDESSKLLVDLIMIMPWHAIPLSLQLCVASRDDYYRGTYYYILSPGNVRLSLGDAASLCWVCWVLRTKQYGYQPVMG